MVACRTPPIVSSYDQLSVDFDVAAEAAGVDVFVLELPPSAAEAFASDFVSDFLSDFPSGLLSAFESESLLPELLFEA
jgi:hypothetical protein